MTGLSRRLDKLEKATRPDDSPQIVLLWSDGATVDGETMDYTEYAERWPDGPGSAHVYRYDIGKDDI